MQMRLFEKEPEEMTLEEAKAAYDHLLRNMSPEQQQGAIECDPQPRESDSGFIAIRKRVFRRIRALE